MNRRSVLAALGSAATLSIAGCTQVGSSSSLDTDRRVVYLYAVDDVPAEHDVEMSAEVLQSSIDVEQTARLAVSTTNTGERRALSVAPDQCALFNRNQGGSDHPKGLWLYRADVASHIDRTDDRWVADRPSDQPRVYPSYACLSKVYENGETVTNEYEIWDDYRVAGYMAPGTYRWEENVRIFSADDDEAGNNEEQIGLFHWGFDIELGVPEDA